MFAKRSLVLLLVVLALLALAACQSDSNQEPAASEAQAIPTVTLAPSAEPVVEAGPASVGDGDLTLRMAIADPSGRASEPFILEFVDQVSALSNGQITIEPVWDAGSGTEQKEEHGVLVEVLGGSYELGLIASRTFEHEGITSFQPLQTPFLIDNDALAVAVAESDMARQLLDALPASGLVGLTLWPEDLRHIFSIVPGEPVLSPEDLAGKTVRTTSEGVTSALIESLGGFPELYASNYERAEAGLLQGYTLTGRPIATGNVTFFSKYQVLFGNGEAFDGLSTEQQAVLREAAAAAQAKALAEHPGDAAAGEAWCADGGTIVMASNDQIAAFREAAQLVVDMITADPANAAAVAALRELKEKTVPSAGAEACVGAAQAQADPSTYANGILNGTWDYVASEEEASFFLADYGLSADEVRIQLGFDNEAWWQAAAFDGATFLSGNEPEGDGGTFHIEGDRLTAIGAGGRAQLTIEWSLDGDQLTLVVVEECAITTGGLNCRDDRSQMDPIMLMVMEHTYTKSSDSPRPWEVTEEWTDGLPPNGVWQVEMTADDFEAAGVLRSVAENDWAGTYTYTFDDGDMHFVWEGANMTAGCQATYEAVEDFVRFTYYSDAGECEGQVDDLQWRLDDDGLHWHVIAIENAPTSEITAVYETRPWQLVEGQ